jgi:hypothetical protein
VKDADRLARLEQAALRCLELLEAGRSEEARRVLAAAVRRPAAARGGEELADLELERAFERARPVAEEGVDAERVAPLAMREVERVAQPAMREADREPAARPAAPPAPFATRTMAELLERQGDATGARRIRDALAAREARSEARPAREAGSEAAPPRENRSGPRAVAGRRDRARVLATLERWLENVRRGV